MAGKKLDVGKSCIRFRKLEDVSKPALRKLLREAGRELAKA